MRNPAAAVFAVIVLACAAPAQAPFEPGRDPQPKVEVASVEPVRVAPGKATSVDIRFRVRRGYHINSNQPKSDLLVPTVLKLDPPTNVSVGRTVYPPGREMTIPFAPEEKLSVYTGDFTLNTHVSAARNTPAGTYRVRGELQYQACDDRACYAPTKLPMYFDVTVGTPRAAKRALRKTGQSPHIRR